MSAYNNTTVRNATAVHYYDYNTMKIVYYTVLGSLMFFGTVINLWMLGALLTSPEMRSRLRNKLICLMLFNNLLKSTLVVGITLAHIVHAFEYHLRFDCSWSTLGRIFRYTVILIENWYFIMFLAQYIFVLLDFDPYKRMSPRVVQIGTIALLVGPWIVGIIVAPSVLTYHSHKAIGVNSKGCIMATYKAYKIIRDLGIVVPFFLKLIVFAGIVVLYHRRKKQDRVMTSTLVGPSTEIDDIKVYVIIVVVSFLTQSLLVIQYLGKFRMSSWRANMILGYIRWYLVEFRAVLMPPCFLILKDVRYRVKTWRPWYRPAPGIDLRVEFDSKDS